MGTKTQILLVSGLFALFVPVSWAMSHVIAGEHQAFWLWSGVRATPEIRTAQSIYLHQAEVNMRNGRVVIERLGLPISRLTFPEIWLTVRFTTLNITDDIPQRLVALLRRWQQAGNHVIGLQIDFDAATAHLENYGQFLKWMRARLPSDIKLSVTGLLDWAKTGDIATINHLPIDELVIQSYQGRKTIENYAVYLPALLNLHVPFKLGLVQHGEWDPQDEVRLKLSPWYQGTVIFMLNGKPACFTCRVQPAR